MNGTRRDRRDGSIFEIGEYGRASDNSWCACAPDGNGCNLSAHDVVEHEDDTITVSPSILVSGGDPANYPAPSWHGYLERDVWRSV